MNEKVVSQKDPDRRYVGLEHLTAAASGLAGWASSSSSISTNGVFREGDTLFGKLRPNLRKCVIASFDGYCSTDILVLRPTEGTEPRFLGRVMQSEAVFGAAVRSAIGTKMPRTSWKELRNLQVHAPHPREQRRIAAILDTVDDAIRKTEQIIAKLKQVKQGLLHDLLTRGIDDNGELRDPVRHPEQFKNSPLGKIPNEWKVVRLGDDARIIHGYAFEGRFFSDRPEGPILLTPGNFHRNGGVYFTPGNTKYFAGRVPDGYTLAKGDLVTVMTDLSPRTLILGRTVVVEGNVALLLNQRIGKILTKHEGLWEIALLCHAMNDERVRQRIIRDATGTTVRHTSPSRMLNTVLARPDFSEQRQICEMLHHHDARERQELGLATKLRLLKKAIAEDLLTGRVRVTPLLEPAP
ncbi:MAG: restriction endonuclease subunit S [Polyangiaceae bacterium]